MLSNKIIGATAAKESLYVDDVASVYLYTGNGSTQTITNNVDLSGEGGLVWIKSRSAATDHQLFNTARGATKELISNSTAAEATDADTLTAFNADGFSLGADSNTNTNAATYASFTFRKAPKFFDIVTYTGTGSNRTIAHNLGSVPGMIIVKRTDSTGNWSVYHRSLSTSDRLILNLTNEASTAGDSWNYTAPTSSVFSLGTSSNVNASGATYVAYLFAHDAGGFGAAGTDNVISCGSFTTPSGSGVTSVNLGWEPQYLLIKQTSGANDWWVIDNMRGMPAGFDGKYFRANTSDSEQTYSIIYPTATGFTTDAGAISASSTYIYMAIRRPMKPPTSGTEVFNLVTYSGNTTSELFNREITGSGFPMDATLLIDRNGGNGTCIRTRLIGGRTFLKTFDTTAATNAGGTTSYGFDRMDGIRLSDYEWNYVGRDYVAPFFKRATGFFDVVCYTGTGSARTVAHNLGVAPELMIVKARSRSGEDWPVLTGSSYDKFMYLNQTAASALNSDSYNSFGNGSSITPPTSSVFTVGTQTLTNANGDTYVAYLFASIAGVSKVGSYTGTGTAQTINCSFTAGARFVLIKRTDSTGDWYVWDTARGIISGNDPYLFLNSTASEVTNTDYIDPVSSGFELSSTAPAAINASGGNFIFFAVA